jgi:hypothetical protein
LAALDRRINQKQDTEDIAWWVISRDDNLVTWPDKCETAGAVKLLGWLDLHSDTAGPSEDVSVCVIRPARAGFS